MQAFLTKYGDGIDGVFAQGGGAANRSPADETSASAIAESEASSDAASREAQADAETPAQTSAVSGSTGTSGNASLSEAAYEGEVKALVQQLYAVKGRAESGLNACIASAKAEYKSLPPEQQTRSRKIAICMSKAGQLSALQASCDSEVNRIVSQMRSVLKANGQSTALADQAMSSYKSQKSARRAALMSQLYG